jgi:hypothetical protein
LEVTRKLFVQNSVGYPEYYMAEPLPDQDICLLGIYWPKTNIVAMVHKGPSRDFCTNNISKEIDLGSQVDSLVYTEIDVEDQKNDGKHPWLDSVP